MNTKEFTDGCTHDEGQLIVCNECGGLFDPNDLDIVLFHTVGSHKALPDAMYSGAIRRRRDIEPQTLPQGLRRPSADELVDGRKVFFDGGCSKRHYGPAWGILQQVGSDWWKVSLENNKEIGMPGDSLLQCCCVPE